MINQRFSLDELGDAFGSELTDALEMGRQLEASIERVGMTLPAVETGFDVATELSGGLGDRVMAALANEPAPTPTGFLNPLRRRGLIRGLRTSVRQAWVGLGGPGRPVLARGAALAYVLVVALAGVSITGAATVATAGALGILGPATTSSPEPSLPAPTFAPPVPTQQAPPPSLVMPSPVAPSPTPSLTPTPSESPDESDDHGGSSGPGSGDDSPGESDDNSGPGSSDDSPGESDDSD